MLRNRPRAVTGNKQALVADHRSQSTATTQNNHASNNKSIFPSFLASRLMHLMIKTALTEPKYVMGMGGLISSPSMTIRINPFSHLKFPFWYQNYHQHPRFPEKFHEVNKLPFGELDSTPRTGLALVDTLSNNKAHTHQESVVKGSDKLVLPGPRSKLEAPPVQEAAAPSGCPNFASLDDQVPLRGCLSVSEMEVSEDYTCVISHGPNPTATHIFGSSVVETYCLPCEVKKQTLFVPDSFLSSCCTCKKRIEQNADIYIYRGEKAFCSSECRYQEILQDEAEIVAEADDLSL